MSNGLAAGHWDQRTKLGLLETPTLIPALSCTARNFGVSELHRPNNFEQLKLIGIQISRMTVIA